MNTTVEQVNDHTVRLTVTVPATDVDAAIDRAYRELAKQVKIPGFRPGKAPKSVIDTHLGRDAVLAEAQERVLDESYPKAVEAEGLKPIASPEVDELEELIEGAEYVYTVDVEVKPELTITSHEGISVTVPPAESSDREVEAQLEHTRERFASLEPVEGRGLEDGDFALLSFTGTVNGEEYEGNVVEKYLYEMGKGLMPTDFDRGLLGLEAGAETRIEFEIPDGSSNEDFVGKMAEFEVTVHEIKEKVLPEFDDDFAGNVGGFETLEELRADIKTKLDEAKATGRARILERAVRTALAERLEGEAPASMKDSRRNSMLSDFLEGLHSRGMSIEQYSQATGHDPEKISKDIEEQAATMVREELALEALFRSLGMEVTEDDITEEIARFAEAAETDVDELRARWDESRAIEVLTEGIMHRRAVEWLMNPENVEIIEEEPAPEGAEPAAADEPVAADADESASEE
ncbi:MAG: trigger factor [Anaerosomatales bacterium]|nr:trigger factor [Anaerosomatales bacterium]MDT8434868.1 trigger factor [Anaerosomatales bacterium]